MSLPIEVAEAFSRLALTSKRTADSVCRDVVGTIRKYVEDNSMKTKLVLLAGAYCNGNLKQRDIHLVIVDPHRDIADFFSHMCYGDWPASSLYQFLATSREVFSMYLNPYMVPAINNIVHLAMSQAEDILGGNLHPRDATLLTKDADNKITCHVKLTLEELIETMTVLGGIPRVKVAAESDVGRKGNMRIYSRMPGELHAMEVNKISRVSDLCVNHGDEIKFQGKSLPHSMLLEETSLSENSIVDVVPRYCHNQQEFDDMAAKVKSLGTCTSIVITNDGGYYMCYDCVIEKGKRIPILDFSERVKVVYRCHKDGQHPRDGDLEEQKERKEWRPCFTCRGKVHVGDKDVGTVGLRRAPY